MKQIMQALFIGIMSSIAFAHANIPKTKSQKKYRVGLLVMATGKYTQFLADLFTSADQYFLPDHEKIYFVFTDGAVPKSDHIIKIPQNRIGWPRDTLMRFSVYYNAKDYFDGIDYLFATDADMLFVANVGNEILGDRVATRHPGFMFELKGSYKGFMFDRHDDYETNRSSTAYIEPGHGDYYFAGGFYGGTTSEFLKMAKTCSDNINNDLNRNYIAIWHDESHLNRYFFDNKPMVILSPSYCFPENWELPFSKKLLALDKNHTELRTVETQNLYDRVKERIINFLSTLTHFRIFKAKPNFI